MKQSVRRSRYKKYHSIKNKNQDSVSKRIISYISSYWSKPLFKTLCGSIETQKILNKTTFRMMQSIYDIPENKRIYIVSDNSESVYLFHIDELDSYFFECETKEESLCNPHNPNQVFSMQCRKAVAKMCKLSILL